METKKFTEILKNRIKEYGFTQKSFAEKMGMTQPQVNNIIMCRERLGSKHTPAWAAALNIDPLWLMTQGEQGSPPGVLPSPPHTHRPRHHQHPHPLTRCKGRFYAQWRGGHRPVHNRHNAF